MILYLDTSALIKLYVNEPYSQLVRSGIDQAVIVSTHLIAYAEMRAALAKAERMERITDIELENLVVEFEQDWKTIEVVKVDDFLVRRAGNLAQQFGLRGFDSIHLAAAEALYLISKGEMEFKFGVFDQHLANAGKALGMKVLEQA